MIIILLHEFGTTVKGSDFCNSISPYLAKQKAYFHPLTYPTNNPHLAHIYLTNETRKLIDYYDDPLVLFVGVGLGGYWARHLARLFPTSRFVLINPCLNPWQGLQQHVGKNVNRGSGTRFQLSERDAIDHYVYRVEKDRVDTKGYIFLDEELEAYNYENHPKIKVLGYSEIKEIQEVISKEFFPKKKEEEVDKQEKIA